MTRKVTYILVMLLLTSSGAYAKAYQFDYQKNIEITGDIELVVNNSYGDIAVTAAQGNMLTINAVKNVRAANQDEAEKIADHIEIKAKRQGRRITLQTNYLRLTGQADSFWDKLLGSGEDSFGDVDFDIVVPVDCDIEIDNTEGTIKVIGIAGNATVMGSSESITLDDVEGDVDVECTTGDVNLDNLRGDIHIFSGGSNMIFNSINGILEIHSTSGDKTGSYISGPLVISQTSGEIELKSVNGDVRIKSSSGNVNLEQQSGAVDITTFTGSVIVKTELYSDKDSYVKTSSGNIIFTIPEMSSGSVDMETVSGKIKTEIPIAIGSLTDEKVTGTFGSNGPKISLMTTSGDITIGQY